MSQDLKLGSFQCGFDRHQNRVISPNTKMNPMCRWWQSTAWHRARIPANTIYVTQIPTSLTGVTSSNVILLKCAGRHKVVVLTTTLEACQ